jgi:hypothetical protein
MTSISPIQLNEPAIHAIHHRLENDLLDIIEDINTRSEDGHQLEPPQTILTYMPSLRELVAFPTIGIRDGISTFEDDTGWSVTSRHVLSVFVFVQDYEQEALAWKLRRYEQAIVRCVLKDRQLGGNDGFGMGLMRIEPGPTLGRRDNPQVKMSWIAVTIWVKRDEES